MASTPNVNQQISSHIYNCPICLSPPTGAFSTRCGHVFCYECIATHLATRNNCPTCHEYVTLETLTPHQPSSPQCAPTPPAVETPDLTGAHSSKRVAPPPLPRHKDLAPNHPNYSSNSNPPQPNIQSSGRAAVLANLLKQPNATLDQILGEDLLAAGDQLSAEQLADVIAKLHEKLQQKEGTEKRQDSQLLLYFLQTTKEEKRTALDNLQKEIQLVEDDVRTIQTDIIRSNPETSSTTSTAGTSNRPKEGPIDVSQTVPQAASSRLKRISSSDLNTDDQRLSKRFATESNSVDAGPSTKHISLAKLCNTDTEQQEEKQDSKILKKKQRLSEYFDVLQKHYFSAVAHLTGHARKVALRSFQDDLVKLTRYNQFRDIATIGQVARANPNNGDEVYRTSNIVSSIEFSRDCELLATAGVTRRIQVFEYNNMMNNPNEVHYAVQDIPTTAKLSWLCWNPYIRQRLLSSDYEGSVILWDVYRGQPISEYEEHESRAWSVDYCPVQPTYFASGSDDGKVKLWSTSQQNSVLTINNNSANVCSVKFHPTQAEKIAFGSVDLHVHYYDLRNTRQPLQVFKSHTRPVSYVKFMSPTQLVSASVDSTVKMWNLSDMSLERTFEGHVNDNNFVGLSVTEDYIACGSEENAVYCYYKAIPRPFTAFPFSLVNPLTGRESRDEDESRFVSSVCWCPKDPTTLVAANSLGSVKILKLDHSDDADTTENDE